MTKKRNNQKNLNSDDKSSKWQGLANFIARTNREIMIIKDIEKDPALKRIHTQRDKIFSNLFRTS